MQVLKPGKYIVVDECMSFWKGIETVKAEDNQIATSDVNSKVMLMLEIQESKETMQVKKCQVRDDSINHDDPIPLQ